MNQLNEIHGVMNHQDSGAANLHNLTPNTETLLSIPVLWFQTSRG